MTITDPARRRPRPSALCDVRYTILVALAVICAREVGPVALFGLVAGLAWSFVQRHPFRRLAAVPAAAMILVVSYGARAGGWLGDAGTSVAVGFALGWAAVAIHNIDEPDPAFLPALTAGLIALALPRTPAWPWALAAAPFALWFYRRPLIEQILEIVLWPMYRITGRGPGLRDFPAHGPVLVVCNHAAWLDPFWLAKVVPRPVVPMMTSKFYDLPVVSWLMRHVVGTVRVQLSGYRREAPELNDAVAVLDRGGVLVVFPEGAMKKGEDQPLRRFGRGVWQILAERPGTPVVACWIEGGWGSFTSYFNGPPAKNKRPDWWRPVAVALAAPRLIDPAVLADHAATRTLLREEVAAARELLGLPRPAGSEPHAAVDE